MSVIVNGEPTELENGTTVSALLASLGLKRDGIAVAIDRRVVPKSQHEATVLQDGASIEVIRAVGGG